MIAMIRRINLFGGPGAGKTGLAAWLFYEFKRRRVNVELAQEFAKILAHRKTPPKGWDQWYIWNKQQRREYEVLREERVTYTITDSPVFLASCYGEFNKAPGWKQLQKASDLFDAEFPALNIYINRCDKIYVQEGRFQDLQQAKQIDRFVLSRLKKTKRKFYRFGGLKQAEKKALLTFILGQLGIPYKIPKLGSPQFRVTWTFESAKTLKAAHGMQAEKELSDRMQVEIRRDIAREVKIIDRNIDDDFTKLSRSGRQVSRRKKSPQSDGNQGGTRKPTSSRRKRRRNA